MPILSPQISECLSSFLLWDLTLSNYLKSLVAPTNPGDLSLTQINTHLTNHYKPRTLEIAEAFKFNKRDQRPGESMSNYAAELRKLATSCNYGDVLQRNLRDRFVAGLQSATIQKSLLKEAGTFNDILASGSRHGRGGQEDSRHSVQCFFCTWHSGSG